MKIGFSLVEMIITIVITAIMALVVAAFIGQSLSAWQISAGRKNLTLVSRAALLRLDREFKVIDATRITTFSATRLTYTDAQNNTIIISQEGTNLYRNADILLDNLKLPGGLAFSFLNSAEGAAATAAEIKTIRTRLTQQKDQVTFVIESAARLRLGKL